MANPYTNLDNMTQLLGQVISGDPAVDTSLHVIADVHVKNVNYAWYWRTSHYRWDFFTPSSIGRIPHDDVVVRATLPEQAAFGGSLWQQVPNPALEGDRGDLYLPPIGVPLRSVMVGLDHLAPYYPTDADVGPSGVLAFETPGFDPDAWTVFRGVLVRQYDRVDVAVNLPAILGGFAYIVGQIALGDITMLAAIGVTEALHSGTGGGKIDG